MKRRRLRTVFQAIVASVPAACGTPPEGVDASTDATTDVTDASVHDSAVLDVVSEDAAVDSYVDWCEAGAPQLLEGDGGTCYKLYYVPCGLPTGDTVDEAGNLSRCDQVCTAARDDLCGLIPPQYFGGFIEAGILDASTVGTTLDGGSALVLCACQGSTGRRPAGLVNVLVNVRIGAVSPLAGYFTQMAHLERASVPAFARMRSELRVLGAPTGLVMQARRAMLDEVKHARMVGDLARRFGGSVLRPRVRRARRRDVEQIARENAVEGCVRETFGALVATWQARHAADPSVRRALEVIACDETRHAELAMRAARFLGERLDLNARKRVERIRRAAIEELARNAVRAVHPDLVRVAGLPTASVSRELVGSLRRERVW